MRFEFGDAAGEVGNGLAFGVWEFAVVEGFGGVCTGADDFSWDANDGAVFRNGVDDDRAGADAGVVADFDIAEHFGAAADNDVVAEGGMALAGFLAGAAESDTLVDEHVVTHFSGFSDDDAHAVIDEKASADGGSGVNLDASKPAGGLRNKPRNQGNAGLVERVGDAMEEDGVQTRVTEQNFDHTFRGRVLPEDGVDLFPDCTEHLVPTIM